MEYRFSLPDPWSRQVFNALARRYGLKPYRERGQHRQSVMLKVSKRFVDETLWPHYLAIHKELHAHLHQVTDRVIRQVLDASTSEADEVAAPPKLGSGGGKEGP